MFWPRTRRAHSPEPSFLLMQAMFEVDRNRNQFNCADGLDKLMANHTLHYKPEKMEEFLAKRGRKKPNKEEEWWKFGKQVKEQETESEDDDWGR